MKAVAFRLVVRRAECARAFRVLSISLGNDWSDAWIATDLPNDAVGILTAQDDRFATIGGLKAYFTANAGMKNAPPSVTSAIASKQGTRYTLEGLTAGATASHCHRRERCQRRPVGRGGEYGYRIACNINQIPG